MTRSLFNHVYCILVCSIACFVCSIDLLIALLSSLISCLIVVLFCVFCMCGRCLRECMSLSVSGGRLGCVLLGVLYRGADAAMAASVCSMIRDVVFSMLAVDVAAGNCVSLLREVCKCCVNCVQSILL